MAGSGVSICMLARFFSNNSFTLFKCIYVQRHVPLNCLISLMTSSIFLPAPSRKTNFLSSSSVRSNTTCNRAQGSSAAPILPESFALSWLQDFSSVPFRPINSVRSASESFINIIHVKKSNPVFKFTVVGIACKNSTCLGYPVRL